MTLSVFPAVFFSFPPFFHYVAFILYILFVLFTTRATIVQRIYVVKLQIDKAFHVANDATWCSSVCWKLKPKIREKEIFGLEELIVSGGGTERRELYVSLDRKIENCVKRKKWKTWNKKE